MIERERETAVKRNVICGWFVFKTGGAPRDEKVATAATEEEKEKKIEMRKSQRIEKQKKQREKARTDEIRTNRV